VCPLHSLVVGVGAGWVQTLLSPITETNRIHLSFMQNRTLGPYLAAINSILVSVMTRQHPYSTCFSLLVCNAYLVYSQCVIHAWLRFGMHCMPTAEQLWRPSWCSCVVRSWGCKVYECALLVWGVSVGTGRVALPAVPLAAVRVAVPNCGAARVERMQEAQHVPDLHGIE
jgi:hypothetical protein